MNKFFWKKEMSEKSCFDRIETMDCIPHVRFPMTRKPLHFYVVIGHGPEGKFCTETQEEADECGDTYNTHKKVVDNILTGKSLDFEISYMTKKEFMERDIQNFTQHHSVCIILGDVMSETKKDKTSCREFLERMHEIEKNGAVVYPSSTCSIWEQHKKTYMEYYGEDYFIPFKIIDFKGISTNEEAQKLLLEEYKIQNGKKYVLKGSPGFGGGQVKVINKEGDVTEFNSANFSHVDHVIVQEFAEAFELPYVHTGTNLNGEFHFYYKMSSDNTMELFKICNHSTPTTSGEPVKTQCLETEHMSGFIPRLNNGLKPSRTTGQQKMTLFSKDVVDVYTNLWGPVPWIRIDCVWYNGTPRLNELTRSNPGFYDSNIITMSEPNSKFMSVSDSVEYLSQSLLNFMNYIERNKLRTSVVHPSFFQYLVHAKQSFGILENLYLC